MIHFYTRLFWLAYLHLFPTKIVSIKHCTRRWDFSEMHLYHHIIVYFLSLQWRELTISITQMKASQRILYLSFWHPFTRGTTVFYIFSVFSFCLLTKTGASSSWWPCLGIVWSWNLPHHVVCHLHKLKSHGYKMRQALKCILKNLRGKNGLLHLLTYFPRQASHFKGLNNFLYHVL